MTKFIEEFNTIDEIKKAIKSRNYEIIISKALEIKVFSAKTTKKYLKEQLNKDLKEIV